MDEPLATPAPATEATSPLAPLLRGATILVLTAGLLASAAVFTGYHAWIAFDRDDIQHLETTLVLVVARELAEGPTTLYGPFSGENPLVLIHAPLYYRLAALGALPIARSGVDPVASAMIAGRSLSFVGLLGILIAAARIARMDGAPATVGVWAALLIAGCPVFGSLAFAVRPDTTGLAFQTIGFGLVLVALRGGPDGSRLWPVFAGLCFALAACAKQHMVVAGGVGALLLLIAAARGRASRSGTILGLLAGAAVLAGYYGWEQHVTGGRMSRSVLTMAREIRHLDPGSWAHVGRVFFEVAKLAIGLAAVAIGVFVAGPKRALVGTRLDATLWLVLLAETAAMVPLCLGSQGAWTNYGMPAVVWASILLARAAMRVLDAPTLPMRTLAIWMGVAGFLAADVRIVAHSYYPRRSDRELLAQVLADPVVTSTPPEARYFVARPQFNRMFGNATLAHDEWLYKQYEAAGVAEPRSRWLAEALSGTPADPNSGPIRVVIVPYETNSGRSDFVNGLPITLPAMGYHQVGQYGDYAVWARKPRG